MEATKKFFGTIRPVKGAFKLPIGGDIYDEEIIMNPNGSLTIKYHDNIIYLKAPADNISRKFAFLMMISHRTYTAKREALDLFENFPEEAINHLLIDGRIFAPYQNIPDDLYPTPELFSDVSGINYYMNRLTMIPKNITSFTALQHLDLGANEITQVDKSLAQCQKLKYLSLAGNKIEILPDLSSCPLEYLDLTSAKISTEDLNFIGTGATTNLTELYISGIKGEFPINMTCCTNLIRFSWNFGSATDVPPKFSQLTKLRALYLEADQMSTETHHITNIESLCLPSLKFLYLGQNEFKLPNIFQRLTGLEFLGLSGVNLGVIPDYFEHFGNLVSLDVSYCGLTRMPRIPNLTRLICHGNDDSFIPCCL